MNRVRGSAQAKPGGRRAGSKEIGRGSQDSSDLVGQGVTFCVRGLARALPFGALAVVLPATRQGVATPDEGFSKVLGSKSQTTTGQGRLLLLPERQSPERPKPLGPGEAD